MVDAAIPYSNFATGVDPVKVIFLTERFSHISFATSLTFFCVVTMLITPSGIPARFPSCTVCVKIDVSVQNQMTNPPLRGLTQRREILVEV